MLRFPDGMRDRLKAEAKKNERSLNAEIISRLSASLSNEQMSRDLSEIENYEIIPDPASVVEKIDNLENWMRTITSALAGMTVETGPDVIKRLQKQLDEPKQPPAKRPRF